MSLSLRSTSLAVLAGALALPTTSCEDPKPVEHDYVKVQFRRADSEDTSPFAGTQEVEINLQYDPCFVEFYTNNPNYASDGLDGAEVFAEFMDDDSKKALCRQKDKTRPVAACETLSIDQDLENNRLKARFRITDSDMEDKVLFVGPIPCPEITGCEGIVSAGGGSGNGFGSNGAPLWHTVSFPQRDAACGQGLPIELTISR